MDFKKFQKNVKKIFKKDMNAVLHANKAVTVALIVIIVLPSLYAILNIDACWDPYENTKDLKFAIVNNDLGGVYEGENLNFGDELVDNLKNNTRFDWRFVSGEEADRGIEDGTYHAAIIIPENFTESILSIKSDNPHSAQLEYIVNAKTNPVSSKIGDTAQKTIQEEVNSEIVKTIDLIAYEKLGILQGSLASGAGQLGSASNLVGSSANQLSAASYKVLSGAKEIEQGAALIEKIYGNNSASELARQSSALASGSSQLASSSSYLASSSANALGQAASSLALASGSLAEVTEANNETVNNYFNSPVIMNKKVINEIDNYGSEVSPFYIILSIWVGCIISCVMFKTRYKNDTYKGEKFSPLEMYFGKMNFFFIIALLQTTVTIIGLTIEGIQIVNFPLFVVTMYIITAALLMFIYSVISVFGNVGKALIFILLVFQIFSTGGTYPVELLAGWCKVISPIMPMTYAISMIKEACLGVYWPRYLLDLVYLAGLFILSLILSMLIKDKYNERANYFEKSMMDSELF